MAAKQKKSYLCPLVTRNFPITDLPRPSSSSPNTANFRDNQGDFNVTTFIAEQPN